jgi:hypothetical protein
MLKNSKSFGLLLLVGCFLLTACSKPAPLSETVPFSPGTCQTDKLTLISGWEGSQDGDLTGSLTLTNNGDTACTLPSAPTVLLELKSGQRFPVQEVVEDSANNTNKLVLDAKASATARLAWHNWCGGKPPDGLYARLDLPYTPKTLRLYALFADPNGQPQLDIPKCTETAKASNINVSGFVIKK